MSAFLSTQASSLIARLDGCFELINQEKSVSVIDPRPILDELNEQGRIYADFLAGVQAGRQAVTGNAVQMVKLVEAFCLLIETELPSLPGLDSASWGAKPR